MFQINFPINVNDTFQDFKDNFCNLYNISPNALAIIFNSNKLEKADLKKIFAKHFDFSNDFFVALQAKTKPCIQNYEFDRTSYSSSSQEIKFIFTVNIPVFCHSFFLYRAEYHDSSSDYYDIEFSIINEAIENFRSDKKKDSKDKKGKKSSSIIYDFEKILRKPDSYEKSKIKKIKRIEGYNYGDDLSDDAYDSDKEENEKIKIVKKKMVDLPMNDIMLKPETIYFMKFRLDNHYNNIEAYNFRSDKIKKSYLKDGFEMTFQLSEDSNRNYLFFGGIGYTIQTIFEKEDD